MDKHPVKIEVMFVFIITLNNNTKWLNKAPSRTNESNFFLRKKFALKNWVSETHWESICIAIPKRFGMEMF